MIYVIVGAIIVGILSIFAYAAFAINKENNDAE